MMTIKRSFLMTYKFFDQKPVVTTTLDGAVTHARSETLDTQDNTAIKNNIIWKQQLAEELQKPIIRKFEKEKVYSLFIDNIWSAHLADMQSISNSNKGISFLLCVDGIFSKYAWVVFLIDKKGIAITNAFQQILQ